MWRFVSLTTILNMVRKAMERKARIPFVHCTVVKIDCCQSTYSVICYLFSEVLLFTYCTFTWFHLILCNTGPILAHQLSLPYAKHWNCALSEFFPTLPHIFAPHWIPCTLDFHTFPASRTPHFTRHPASMLNTARPPHLKRSPQFCRTADDIDIDCSKVFISIRNG